jgi:hypothetical protein
MKLHLSEVLWVLSAGRGSPQTPPRSIFKWAMVAIQENGDFAV